MAAGRNRAQLDPARAAELAVQILTGDEERIRHSAGVAARAEALAVGLDGDPTRLLVVAAWLHDVGYAEPTKTLGFHPVDGARHLQKLGCAPVICDLVAHHSGSRFVADVRGLSRHLAPFHYAEDSISDTLAVADQTAGPDGRPMTIDERMADMLRRHGPDSPNARAHPRREPFLRAAATRVASRLEAHGVGADRHRISDCAAGASQPRE